MNVLAEYPSKSNPSKKHFIIQPVHGGDPYCTCWGWKKNRTCIHLEHYSSEHLKTAFINKAETILETPYKKKANSIVTGQTITDKYKATIEEIISELTGART
jgi:hypothetical protein